MTNVQCNVIECQFNENGYCQEEEITIGESGDCFTFEFSDEEPQEDMRGDK